MTYRSAAMKRQRPISNPAGRFVCAGLAISLSLASGCATPAQRFDQRASALGLTHEIVPGEGFLHAVYRSQPPRSGSRLHVYLGGDGSPRRAVRADPPDPTPANSPALELMAVDDAPSLFLGRPCHHAVARCDPWYWTLGRYSEAVVESMTVALRRLLAQRGDPGPVLIGFSGGGALAMLIAERLPETRAVVTVAGNLDPEAWASHRGFRSLQGSLDPARRTPLPGRVLQIHLRGGRDRVVPADLTQRAIDRQPGARSRLYPEFDHDCCWESVWPQILTELSGRLDRPIR